MKKNYFITLLLSLCFSTISFWQSALITGYVDAPCSGATPRTVEIYVDGVLIRETNNSKWHQEQFINIDSETMPDWLGLPNDNDLPSVFYVDYVRTWQKS